MTPLSECSLFDLHCHLDFMANARTVALAASAQQIGIMSCSVVPPAFHIATALFDGCSNVCVAAGAHPWWAEQIGADTESLKALRDVLYQVCFIGEVGLDFSRRCTAHPDVQRAVFRTVLDVCAAKKGHVVSVHAVYAAGEVLDMLEESECLSTTTVIFHWFSGTSDQLTRALQAGCFFSVGERMLASRRGRSYAQHIPADRLLLETDAPDTSITPPCCEASMLYTADHLHASLSTSLAHLEALRGESLASRIAYTSCQLLYGANGKHFSAACL